MTEPRIVIGIGAQKAASSWLQVVLGKHPDCHMTRVKGLHYFNKFEPGRADRDVELVRRKLGSVAAKRSKGIAEVNGLPIDQFASEIEAWAALTKHDTFDLDAYRNMLFMNAGDAAVVGEVTPAYSSLSRDILRLIYSVSPNVRLVYILRDPVQRLWSAARMRGRRHVEEAGGERTLAIATVEAYLAGDVPEYDKRSDYAGTLANLDAIAPRAHVHLDFFEHLFDGGVDRVFRFLDLAPMDLPEVAPVNAGLAADLPASLGRAVFDRLSAHYTAAEQYLGDLPEEWKASMREYG
ncbi:sulfotransferase [Tateyamaria omphalii]|uniref:sulfotransferase n=1 Tax=Tateyamaria omphalii TaxID=299262 RepID=UPI001C992E1D|nr:sulfotransferase [Tateyamaria omphalii]MBY5932226.1 sulfotransferase [Tateyamaria omphalii]